MAKTGHFPLPLKVPASFDYLIVLYSNVRYPCLAYPPGCWPLLDQGPSIFYARILFVLGYFHSACCCSYSETLNLWSMLKLIRLRLNKSRLWKTVGFWCLSLTWTSISQVNSFFPITGERSHWGFFFFSWNQHRKTEPEAVQIYFVKPPKMLCAWTSVWWVHVNTLSCLKI